MNHHSYFHHKMTKLFCKEKDATRQKAVEVFLHHSVKRPPQQLGGPIQVILACWCNVPVPLRSTGVFNLYFGNQYERFRSLSTGFFSLKGTFLLLLCPTYLFPLAEGNNPTAFVPFVFLPAR